MDHKIGRRQRWAWLLAGWSAVAGCCLCGMNWLWVGIGALVVTGIAWFLDEKSTEDGWSVAITLECGNVQQLVHGLVLLWAMIVLTWTATLADLAFPTVDGFPELGWVLLAMTAWGVSKGADVCARCCGVLCLFVLVLYTAVGAFALPDFEWNYLSPKGQWQQGFWTMGLCFVPCAVLYLPGKKEGKGTIGLLRWLPPLMAGVLALITAGVLSPKLAAIEPVPLYRLAQSVSLFGVMERMEPLLSAAMTMGVFSLMTILASVCQSIVDQFSPWKWSGAVCCAIAAGGMMIVKELSWTIIALGNIIVWGAVPMAIFVKRQRRMRNGKRD